VAEAIDSALGQTYPVVEVVLVDDGSTDSSADIAKGYGDRIRYTYQPNAGLSAARNTGISLASHPLVALLDADDRFVPNAMEKMISALESLSTDFAIVACYSENIDVDGKPMAAKQKLLRGGEVTVRDLIQKTRFPCNVVAKKIIFEQCGLFDTALKSSEDRDMWIRTAVRFRIHVLPERLAEIRRHGENMSKNAVRQSRSIRMVLRKAYQSSAVPRWDLPFWMNVYAIYLFQSGLMFAEAGENSAGAVSLIGSIFLWPWFANPAALGQPRFFRIRRVLRILAETVVPVAVKRRDASRQESVPQSHSVGGAK